MDITISETALLGRREGTGSRARAEGFALSSSLSSLSNNREAPRLAACQCGGGVCQHSLLDCLNDASMFHVIS